MVSWNTSAVNNTLKRAEPLFWIFQIKFTVNETTLSSRSQSVQVINSQLLKSISITFILSDVWGEKRVFYVCGISWKSFEIHVQWNDVLTQWGVKFFYELIQLISLILQSYQCARQSCRVRCGWTRLACTESWPQYDITNAHLEEWL